MLYIHILEIHYKKRFPHHLKLNSNTLKYNILVKPMAFLDKVIGHGDVSEEMDKDYVSEFFFDDEEVIQSYQFIRDQIILTNYGIYEVDVQGLSGKKVEVKFFPKDTIKTISFETAGTLDFDVDIKIGVTNNTVVNVDGAAYSEPLSFKVPSSQAAEAKEVVRLVKEHYLF